MVEQNVDVCIVGAGITGVTCAQGLARAGVSVLLLDRLHPLPACLKAEKISGEGVPALLRLGFRPVVDTALTPLHNVAVFFGERALGTLHLDPPEAGLLYHDFINTLRAHLDPRVVFRPGVKAAGFEPQPDGVTIVTDQGERIGCRLLVLATGEARHLLEPLGAVYEPEAPHQISPVAFTFEGRLGDGRTPVNSQTYHHPMSDGPISYVTLFRLGTAIRANISCQGPVPKSLQRELKQDPLAVLAAQNRLLAQAAPSWRVVSPVLTRKLSVGRVHPPALSRVVLLGDAAHTVDPTAGTGLTLALLEVELLLESYVSRWLEEDACGPEAIAAFYADSRRQQAAGHAFGGGRYIFALNHDLSLRGRWRRIRFALDQRRAAYVVGRPRLPHRRPISPGNCPRPCCTNSTGRPTEPPTPSKAIPKDPQPAALSLFCS